MGFYLQESDECADVSRVEDNLLSLVSREQRISRFDAFFDCLGLRFKWLVYSLWIGDSMNRDCFLFLQNMLDFVDVFLELIEDFLLECLGIC